VGPRALAGARLGEYARAWAEREFGPEHVSEIADIVTRYTTYNGRRKPEMLEPRTYSLVDYREADTVADDYQRLARQADASWLCRAASRAGPSFGKRPQPAR
jgi:uncharacterized protein YceH (UPF0502 family)